MWLRDDSGLGIGGDSYDNIVPTCRLPHSVISTQINASVEDLFHHVLAVLHDPAYREANAGALRMEWPRIPLPGWPDGDTLPRRRKLLPALLHEGRELAALLDPDTPVPGVTTGTLRPDIAAIAVPAHGGRAEHERATISR